MKAEIISRIPPVCEFIYNGEKGKSNEIKAMGNGREAIGRRRNAKGKKACGCLGCRSRRAEQYRVSWTVCLDHTIVLFYHAFISMKGKKSGAMGQEGRKT